MLEVKIWEKGKSLGNLSSEEVEEIQGRFTGPVVAVIDDNGNVNIIQPMDPNTGENWGSEDDAIQFGRNYINPPELYDNIEE